jgi:hypothetical protein
MPRRDSVFFCQPLPVRVESAFFRRRWVMVVQSTLPGYTGNYLLICEGEAQVNQFRGKDSADEYVVATAYRSMQWGVRIFFFNAASSVFANTDYLGLLGPRPDSSVSKAQLAVDVQRATDVLRRPTRVFLQPDSRKQLVFLRGTFSRCCQLEANRFRKRWDAKQRALQAVPRIFYLPQRRGLWEETPGTGELIAGGSGGGGRRGGGRGRAATTINTSAPLAPDEAHALTETNYTPHGHPLFRSRYFATRTGVAALQRQLRVNDMVAEGVVHALLVLALLLVLGLEVTTSKAASADMESWVMTRVGSLAEATTGAQAWAALAAEFVDFVALVDPTNSRGGGGTSDGRVDGDYTGGSYSFLGGARPITARRIVAWGSGVCVCVRACVCVCFPCACLRVCVGVRCGCACLWWWPQGTWGQDRFRDTR